MPSFFRLPRPRYDAIPVRIAEMDRIRNVRSAAEARLREVLGDPSDGEDSMVVACDEAVYETIEDRHVEHAGTRLRLLVALPVLSAAFFLAFLGLGGSHAAPMPGIAFVAFLACLVAGFGSIVLLCETVFSPMRSEALEAMSASAADVFVLSRNGIERVGDDGRRSVRRFEPWSRVRKDRDGGLCVVGPREEIRLGRIVPIGRDGATEGRDAETFVRGLFAETG